MTMPLFDRLSAEPRKEELAPGAFVLRGFALPYQADLVEALREITAKAPFRHLITPGGYRMSVAMTNCGSLGWISDRTGYRYDPVDPESGKPWPAMPACFLDLAMASAVEAGFSGIHPNACLINRYESDAKLSLHQDKDELDFRAPIVSVSLGVPAIFLFGGLNRADKTKRVSVTHGDVVVWGGPSRLNYHGVLPLKPGYHPLFAEYRVNLTFRTAE